MFMTFSHIGEEVVAKMANENPTLFIEALGLSNEEVDWQHIHSAKPFAYRHCKLSPLRDIAFDGQHQVDVVLWVKPEYAIPLELKLGMTQLTRKWINTTFRGDCGKSHRGSRIRGTMISILERRPGCVSVDEDLYVMLGNNKRVKLAPTWGLLMQQSVLDRWNGKLAALSDNVVRISIQKLVHDFGGKRPFNALVEKIVDFDYFDEWELDMRERDVMPARTSEQPPAPL